MVPPHFLPLAPKCALAFLLSARESVSLSSAAAFSFFFFETAVFFSVDEVGVGASEDPLSLLAKVVERGVGAPAGVEAPEAGVAPSDWT
jgi:hypothetical protein